MMFTSMEFMQFLNRLRSSGTIEDLHEVIAEFTHWLGLDRFALGHHVDLARPPHNAVRITNYDQRWIDQVMENRYFTDDPIHARSMKTVAGFRWDDLGKLTERQSSIIYQARQYGLVAGYTVPVFLPGEYAGTCSFAGKSFDNLRPYAWELSDSFACAAFEKARIIMQKRDGRDVGPAPELAPRQREAVIFLSRGKTDREIGEIMRISHWTAHDHIEAARDAYGRISRTSLVLRAVFDNQITFADAFWR